MQAQDRIIESQLVLIRQLFADSRELSEIKMGESQNGPDQQPQDRTTSPKSKATKPAPQPRFEEDEESEPAAEAPEYKLIHPARMQFVL